MLSTRKTSCRYCGPTGPSASIAKGYSGKSLADAERLYAEFVDVARTGASHTRLRADMRAAGDAHWLADLAIIRYFLRRRSRAAGRICRPAFRM